MPSLVYACLRLLAKVNNSFQIRIFKSSSNPIARRRILLLPLPSRFLRFRYVVAEDAHRVLSFGQKEPITLRMLNLMEDGDVFVDVGASNGIYSLPAAVKVGTKGLVVAIEPDSRKLSRLVMNAANNTLNCQLVVENCFVGSSTKASLSTLDDLFERLVLPDPTFVKIDVDGPELEVLKGFRHGLSKPKPIKLIQIEFDESNKDLVNFLAEFGYRLIAFEPSPFSNLNALRAESLRGNGWFVNSRSPH